MKPLEALKKAHGLTDRAAKALLDVMHGKNYSEQPEAYLRRKGVGGSAKFDDMKRDQLVAVYEQFQQLGKSSFWAAAFQASAEVAAGLSAAEENEPAIYDGPTLPRNWSVNEKGQALNQFGRVA